MMEIVAEIVRYIDQNDTNHISRTNNINKDHSSREQIMNGLWEEYRKRRWQYETEKGE